jgi:MFS family permease
MPPEFKLPNRAWLTVGLLWFIGLLNYLDRVMITTMRGSIVAEIPMTEAQFGLLTAAFLWTYGILSPFAGFLADRFSRSRVIVISLFAWSFVTWLTAHATTYTELLATRVLMGVTEAAYIPAALALITDYHRGHTRSRAEGIHMSGIMVGAGLGGVGGWIAERHGWEHSFTLFGLIGLGYAFVVAFFLKDAPRERPSNTAINEADELPKIGLRAAFVSLFSKSSFTLALIYWGLLGMGGWAVVGWMPTYMNENFNLAQGVAGLTATGYLQTALLVGVIVGGAWADRWFRTNPFGRFYVPFIGLCCAAPGIFLAGSTNLLPLAIVGLVVYGFARAFADCNMMPILCQVTDPRYRATGYGVLNLCGTVVGGFTIYAGGALRDAKIDVSLIFGFASVSMVGCAALLLLIKSHAAADR